MVPSCESKTDQRVRCDLSMETRCVSYTVLAPVIAKNKSVLLSPHHPLVPTSCVNTYIQRMRWCITDIIWPRFLTMLNFSPWFLTCKHVRRNLSCFKTRTPIRELAGLAGKLIPFARITQPGHLSTHPSERATTKWMGGWMWVGQGQKTRMEEGKIEGWAVSKRISIFEMFYWLDLHWIK